MKAPGDPPGAGPTSWRIVHEAGSVDHLHHLPDPGPDPVDGMHSRTVRILRPSAPAIVLGSSQSESVVDAVSASRLGLEVTRRRSGGGAVLVCPGEQVWVDLLVPRGDPLWHDDIVKAAAWAGEAWADALSDLGVAGCEIHTGRLQSTDWSTLICFAGLGPGEITVAGAKLMGLSQRRGRDWIRIQSAVNLVWRPELLVEALALDEKQRASCLSALRGRVMALDVSEGALLGSLLSSLPD